jgi:hypothetical protein
MPTPVRGLYFDTLPLLNAFEKSPTEALDKLDWNTLLAKGEAILHAYREWTGESNERFL